MWLEKCLKGLIIKTNKKIIQTDISFYLFVNVNYLGNLYNLK